MSIETFEKQTQEKREHIILVGMEEFSQNTFCDVKTDIIVQKCGISKGLLFHYFGSKKAYYLYCLSKALDLLIDEPLIFGDNFYDILFHVMDEKLKLCTQYPLATAFINMASRDASNEIASEKAKLFSSYRKKTQAASFIVMDHAVSTLTLSSTESSLVKEGLSLYCNAVIEKYLRQYQYQPNEFFQNMESIKEEMIRYIDLILYGVVSSPVF